MKSLVGKTISHYQILDKLGEGGMGVVYKAEDTRLKRPVALKFLSAHLTRDPEANKRFIYEAQAASALDHQNVCTIYQVDETDDGQMFIAMAYYEGETLKEKIADGPLSQEEALSITIQIAHGLTKAHEKGIVHRDINPSNIIIRPDGVVKIIDFGLTKLLGATQITETGTRKGTVAYMSPEQAAGSDINHRTDIWSLGVVLYEMLTGKRPFAGDHYQAVIFRILNQAPEDPYGLNSEISPELAQIINKALEKKPQSRYQDTSVILADLKKEEAQTSGINHRNKSRFSKVGSAINYGIRKKSSRLILLSSVFAVLLFVAFILSRTFNTSNRVEAIAVLPLANLSGDPEQAYISDGMTADLINNLAKIRSLHVISLTSSMHYKDTDKTIPEIAAELKVGFLVEGSVRMSDDQAQVTVQLVDGHSDRHLWAERYTRDISNAYNLYYEIVRTIADEIELPLTPEENRRFSGLQSVHPDVYRYFQRGKHFRKGLTQNQAKAIEYFKKAISIDSTFALGYAELANTYTQLGISGGLSREKGYEKGTAAIKKALALDDQLAEAHATDALLKMWYEWDWIGAEKAFKRALDLIPGSVDIYDRYLTFLVATQQKKEGLAIVRKMLDADPHSPRLNLQMGWTYLHLGEYELAEKQLKYTADLSPASYWPHVQLAWVYAVKGDYAKALEKCEFLIKNYPKKKFASFGWIYAAGGQVDKALNILKRLEENYHKRPSYTFQIAKIYAALGNNDKAFEWLEIAYQRRLVNFALFQSVSKENHPPLGLLRSDPRYADFLARLNFPQK